MLKETVYKYKCSDTSACEPIAIMLTKGIYKFECWGAQGGTGLKDGKIQTEGGRGSYVVGQISIRESSRFYLYIGGKGTDGNANQIAAKGGWNGGGLGGIDTDNDGSGGGGGSTDIRLSSGNWNDTDSLISRIIVAAGGSGSAYKAYGAPGGELNGYIMKSTENTSYSIEPRVSQISGNALGAGENGVSSNLVPSSGSGGGYYGGKSGAEGEDGNSYVSISSSGSSYISGYEGCSDNSKYIFKNPLMLGGYLNFNSPNGTLEKGHIGNGAIRITKIASFPTCRGNKKSNTLVYVLLLSLHANK